MKKTILGTITFLVLSSVQTFANGRDGGNGGDVLVCENDEVILLDKYEAKEKSWEIELQGETLTDKVKDFLKRFTRIDPVRAEVLKVYLDELLEDFNKLDLSKNQVLDNLTTTEQELQDIDDSIHLAIPQGCEKRQLVIQQAKYSKISKFTTRYVFNRLLLEKLDLENLAMTIIHEALFRMHITEGANDSRFTRLLNGFISSKPDVGLGAYLGLIEDAVEAGYILSGEKDEKDDRWSFTIKESSLDPDVKDKSIKFYANKFWIKLNPKLTESLHGRRWLVRDDEKIEFLIKTYFGYRYILYSKEGKLIASYLYYPGTTYVSPSPEYNYVRKDSILGTYNKIYFANGEIEISTDIQFFQRELRVNSKICSNRIKAVINGKKVISNNPGCVILNNGKIEDYTVGNTYEVPDLNKFRQ